MTMLIILVNAIAIAVETSQYVKQNNSHLFSGLDLGFVTYYSVEISLKIYASPCEFWASSYNLVRLRHRHVLDLDANEIVLQFDIFILLTSYVEMVQLLFGLSLDALGNVTFLRVLRTLRALRALRGISFIRSLQVLVNALGSTLSEVINLLGLLVLWIYIFSVMGFYFFGYEDNVVDGTSIDPHWNSLGSSFMSLFVYVTADGWTDIQFDLDNHGYAESKMFSVCFLFVGHFIFMNLFIGVIIQNIEQAALEDKAMQEETKQSFFVTKKQKTIAEQDESLSKKAGSNLTKIPAGGQPKSDCFPELIPEALTTGEENLVTLTHGPISKVSWLNSYELLLFRRKLLIEARISTHVECGAPTHRQTIEFPK
eukprot:SAG31_NODE_201_length_20535_cov_15.315081_21_plen_369_part_00